MKFGKSVIILLLFSFSSISFYYISIGIIDDANETKLSVIMERFERFYHILRENGTLASETPWSGWWASWTVIPAYILLDIYYLVESGYTEILERVNVTWMLEYLAKRQSPWGDFAPLTNYGNYTYLEGFFLIGTYYTLLALKLWDAMHLINVTAVQRFALDRYDNVTGGFKEPVLVIDGKEIAMAAFPSVGVTSSDMYRVPNILNTFASVAILNLTGGLNLIDVDRVLSFILACRNEYGLFMPTPNTSALPVPWPYQKGNFIVDSAGSGLAYNFAGIMSLYYLGRLDVLSYWDRLNIIEYIKALKHGSGSNGFKAFLFDRFPSNVNFFYVFPIFDVLDFVSEYRDWLFSIMVNFTNANMYFNFDDSFPIPRRLGGDTYCYIESTYFNGYGFEDLVIYPLFVIGRLDFLDSLTPRAIKVRENFAILSVIFGFIVSVVYVVLPRIPSIFNTLFKRRGI